MLRRLTLPLLLVGCFGVPYLASQDDLGGRIKGMLPGSGSRESTEVTIPVETPHPVDENGQPVTQVSLQPALAGPQITELGEMLRFDITPNWVLSRWTRVSTAPAGVELEGMRVPVVTGTQPQDLAGSLTYYFDREHVLQRIDFRGTTGDPSRLAGFVAQHYELEREESLDAILMMKKWNGKPISVLRVRRDTVVQYEDTRGRYQVLLELNRPQRGVHLSEPFLQELEADRRGGRWD